MPITLGKVIQIGWKDNTFVLTISIVYNRTICVIIVRKRPKKTLISAKTARVPFEDQPTKALEISKVYDFYNHKINAINIAD